MKWTICFTTPGGVQACLPAALIVDPRLRMPWEAGGKPQPDPWFIDKRVSKEKFKDIATLGQIAELSEQLSPALRREFEALTERSARGVELPEDYSLSFGKTRQAYGEAEAA